LGYFSPVLGAVTSQKQSDNPAEDMFITNTLHCGLWRNQTKEIIRWFRSPVHI